MKNKNVSHTLSLVLLFVMLFTSCRRVDENQPKVSISSPTTGSTLELYQETTVLSAILAPDGIAYIELYVNDTLIRSDPAPAPGTTALIAEQKWIPTLLGQNNLKVLVYDTRGRKSTTAEVIVTIAQTSLPMNTHTPEILNPTATQELPVTCTNQAEFIQDVTIPSNSVLSPGLNFIKTWRLLNNGTCNWEGYHLIYIRGDLLGGVTPVAIPYVASGSSIDASVNLIAPNYPGTYLGVWRLRAADGTIFGPELSYSIIIPQPNTPTSTNTNTQTATSTFTRTSTSTNTITPTTPLAIYSSMVYEQVTISPGDYGTTTAVCPTGSIVTSGGFALSDGLWFYNSSKEGNGWKVYAKNNTGANKLMSVYAVCLHNTGGSTQAILNQTTAAPTTWTKNQATCPAGTLIVGGGFVTYSGGGIDLYNSSKDGNGWTIYVNNLTSNERLFNVYAICLSGVSGSITQAIDHIFIPAGERGHGEVSCPTSTVVTGGGFAMSPGMYVYNMTKTDNGWQNFVNNYLWTEKQVNTYAICFSP